MSHPGELYAVDCFGAKSGAEYLVPYLVPYLDYMIGQLIFRPSVCGKPEAKRLLGKSGIKAREGKKRTQKKGDIV